MGHDRTPSVYHLTELEREKVETEPYSGSTEISIISNDTTLSFYVKVVF
jgi:hypothetical protein